MFEKIKSRLDKDANLKELVSGSLVTFILKMSGMALGFMLIYLISKYTGAEGVGYYQYSLQVVTILSIILGLGMNNAVLRYVGQFNNDEQRAKMHLLFAYFMRIIGPLSIIIGVLIYFQAPTISRLMGKGEEYTHVFQVVGIIVPFFTINQINVEFIRGLKKLKISELIRSTLRPLLMTIGIALFYRDQLNKEDVLVLLFAAICLNSFLSFGSIINELKKIPKSNLSFDQKELLKTSFPMMLTGISSVLLVAMPILFLDYFSDQKEVGVYSVVFSFASLVSLVLVIVNTIAAPKFSELYWSNKIEELQKLINHSAKLMFWVALLICFILVVGSEIWLGIFGDEYLRGSSALLFLVIGQLVNAATGSVGVFMNMTGLQNIVRNIHLIGVVIIFVSYLFIVPNYGLYGASIVAMIGSIAINLALVIYVQGTRKIKTYYLPTLRR